MKRYYIAFVAAVLLFSSCNSFLDKLPDDRAEVDTEKKVNSLLSTAYPDHSAALLLEMSSDNVMDNGKLYTAQPNQEMMYRWQEVTTTGNDDPRMLWNSIYYAVATANQALESIDAIDADNLKPQRAEALLCRAFGMFQLANIFCMAYNPGKAKEYLGLPYPMKPEQDVNAMYERGTLEQLYAKIDADIEAALPMVDDAHLAGKPVKYHFNRMAAYAFAARFNLYYQKWEKAVKYASEVLGANPLDVQRDYKSFLGLAGNGDINNAYINSGEKANLMLITATSLAGRVFVGDDYYLRYNHNRPLCIYETYWSNMLNSEKLLHKLYGPNQSVYFPKIMEKFEYADKVIGTGFPHIVDAIFTGEETLLVRAEANAMMKNYAKAFDDMNTWQTTHCEAGFVPCTETSVNDFMNNIAYSPVVPKVETERTTKKRLNPQGFTIEAGTQENVIQAILQMRRVETMYQGMRFQDLKRYGIEFSHNLEDEEAIVFKPGDLRGAIQLPSDVVVAGLAANPR